MMTKFVVFCLFASLCIQMSTQQENAHDCSLAKDEGPCRSLIPRFYFNTATGTCDRFFYGGCGGNTNNFEVEEDCKTACIPARK